MTHQSYKTLKKFIPEDVKETLRKQKRTLNLLKARINPYLQKDDTDVYVISYPNSGRTWLVLLIGKAMCDRYNLDEKFMLDTLTLTQKAGVLTTTFTHDCSLVDVRKSQYYYTEELFFNKPKYQGKKIILLLRDPRDVMVSYYFQQTKRDGNYKGDISNFIRDANFGIHKLLKFNQIWLEHQANFNDFLLLSYEKLRVDTPTYLGQILEFMGVKEISSELLETATEFSKFDNMKKLEKQNYFQDHAKAQQMQPRQVGDNDSYKTRKGKVGGFVDDLNPEDVRYINQAILEANLPCYQDLNLDLS